MRRSNGTALLVVALLGTLDALPFPVWSYTGRAAGTVPTRWGLLTAADRDLIVRLRLAELWQLPAAQQALELPPGGALKEAADQLIVGHTTLGRRVRMVARDLGVELPDRPTAQQRGRLRQLTAASGEDYEKAWANLLRAAHGTLFPAIGAVRNETRNSLVRQLASAAHQIVLDHITVLGTTGAAGFETITDDSTAAATAGPVALRSSPS